MKRLATATCTWIWLWSAALAPLAAQTPPAPPQPPASPQAEVLAALQAKETFSDEDRATIRGWVQKRVEEIVGNDAAAAGPAVEKIRAELKGSQGFRDALHAALLESARPAIRAAPPAAAARLLATVNALSDPAAQPLLIESLRDERTAVRMAAAVGLRDQRQKLVTAGNTLNDAIAALRDAAKKESSATVLRTLYHALNYPEVTQALPDVRALAVAALDVFETRAALHDGKELRGEGAELVGMRLMAALRPALSDSEREKYIQALARVLRHAVMRWSSELHTVRDRSGNQLQIQLRNTIEQIIEDGETQLTALLGGAAAGTVAAEMRKANPITTKIEFNKWAEQIQKTYSVDLKIPIGEKQ